MFKNVLALFALLLIAVCPVFAGHHSQTVVFHDGHQGNTVIFHNSLLPVGLANVNYGVNSFALQGNECPQQGVNGFNGFNGVTANYGVNYGESFERGIRIIRRPRPTIIIR